MEFTTNKTVNARITNNVAHSRNVYTSPRGHFYGLHIVLIIISTDSSVLYIK